MTNRTRRYALRLDHQRRRMGPTGNLTLLHFIGAHEFAPIGEGAEITSGWNATFRRERERQKDEPVYISVEVAAITPPTDALLEQALHFAIEGTVYEVNTTLTRRPLGEPRVWMLQAFPCGDRWPA